MCPQLYRRIFGILHVKTLGKRWMTAQQFASNWFDGPDAYIHRYVCTNIPTCNSTDTYVHTYIHTWTGGELLFVWFAGFAPAATINGIIEVKFRHPLYPQQGRSGISGPCAKHPGGHECYCLDIKYRKFLVYKTFYKMKKLIRLIFKKLSVAYVLWTLLFLIDYVANAFYPSCPTWTGLVTRLICRQTMAQTTVPEWYIHIAYRQTYY